ncbi:MAG: aldo/keto reductase [Deltaproteobacteria bacterium]|nr:aldo/keto reductase [Deltaproteobacteria bacterium]
MAGETRDSKNSALLGRRDFLIRGSSAAAAVAALGLPRPAWAAPDGPPRVRRYTTLGRTGLKVSDISFGSSRSADPALVEHAFARGINYFDCAESYKGGNSELAIGRALRGKRDEVYLTSKVKCGVDTKRSSLMQALERSLKRLQTDHVDISSRLGRSSRERSASPACRDTEGSSSRAWTTHSITIWWT